MFGFYDEPYVPTCDPYPLTWVGGTWNLRTPDRRYAEDILRRELENLRLQFNFQFENLCKIYRDDYIGDELSKLEIWYRRKKEHLYRQFDTYNQPYKELYNMPSWYTAPIPYNIYRHTAKSFIIIGSSGAAPKPAAHTTLGSAETEANRLAKKHPGEEFVVYSTVKSYKVEEKPVTVKVFG